MDCKECTCILQNCETQNILISIGNLGRDIHYGSAMLWTSADKDPRRSISPHDQSLIPQLHVRITLLSWSQMRPVDWRRIDMEENRIQNEWRSRWRWREGGDSAGERATSMKLDRKCCVMSQFVNKEVCHRLCVMNGMKHTSHSPNTPTAYRSPASLRDAILLLNVQGVQNRLDK